MKIAEGSLAEYRNRTSTSSYAITAKTNEEASRFFANARNNLFNINDWQRLAGKSSAAFVLADGERQPVSRQAVTGDQVRIEFQNGGTGLSALWVRIDDAKEKHEDPLHAWAVLRIRMIDTFSLEDDEADEHKTSSTFIVERKGNNVSASVFGSSGQREKESEGLLSTLRRKLMPVDAVTGLSTPQWQNLVKGMLKVPYNALAVTP